MKDVDIIDFGLLNHQKLHWLAASPDGITPDGVMLEIKCPFIRKIKPKEFPMYYWVQVQIQLEVCDLYECDYIECSIKEVEEEYFHELDENVISGIILRKPGTEEYVYPPKDIVSVEEHLVWIAFEDKELELVFYYIDDYQILKINRDKEWFESVKDDLKGTFDIIDSYQKDKELFLKHNKEFEDDKNKKFKTHYESSVCMI